MSERPDCYTHVWRKARKEHKCCECLRPIFKGEKYEYFSAIWEGSADWFKTCRCCALKREFILSKHGEVPLFEELWEYNS